MITRDLEVMIDLVHSKYNKVFTDYKELANIINKEFSCNITDGDIWNYYEPEVQDKIIHSQVLQINY